MSNIADYQDNMLKSAYMKACFQYRQRKHIIKIISRVCLYESLLSV